MRQSESIAKFSPAFLEAQKKMVAVQKNRTVRSDKYSFKYAELESVIEEIKGPLNEQGISFLQFPKTVGDRVYVETMLLHTTGEFIAEEFSVPASNNSAQGIGSAISYARRYGLLAICGIPSKDDDGQEASKPAKAAAQAPTATGLAPFETDLSKLAAPKKDAMGFYQFVFPDAGMALKTRDLKVVKELSEGKADKCRAVITPGRNGEIAGVLVTSSEE